MAVMATKVTEAMTAEAVPTEAMTATMTTKMSTAVSTKMAAAMPTEAMASAVTTKAMSATMTAEAMASTMPTKMPATVATAAMSTTMSTVLCGYKRSGAQEHSQSNERSNNEFAGHDHTFFHVVKNLGITGLALNRLKSLLVQLFARDEAQASP